MVDHEAQPGHDDKYKQRTEVLPHVLLELPAQDDGHPGVGVELAAEVERLPPEAGDRLVEGQLGRLRHVLGVLDGRPVGDLDGTEVNFSTIVILYAEAK